MSINTITRSVTIPWGAGAKVPPENLGDEAKVRSRINDIENIANSHLEQQDSAYVGNGFSRDLDPSPERLLRTRKFGDSNFVLEIEAKTAENSKKQQPVSLIYKGTDNPIDARAQWESGRLVSFSESYATDEGVTVGDSITVNDNGTLTYTTVTADESTSQPVSDLALQS